MRIHNLFISHSWAYSDAYDNLVNLLDARPYFRYRNYSVPQESPLHTSGTDKALYAAIKKQIAPSGVILILAGVYASYSKWIDKEIQIAKTEFQTPKPIIAIEPWGSQRTSVAVKNAADKIVSWNTESIVSAIRELDSMSYIPFRLVENWKKGDRVTFAGSPGTIYDIAPYDSPSGGKIASIGVIYDNEPGVIRLVESHFHLLKKSECEQPSSPSVGEAISPVAIRMQAFSA